jgi:hypothetical protein
MRSQILVIGKSDKHNGYCVAGVDKRGKCVRLVRDEDGHALPKEDCEFKKLDLINIDMTAAPPKNQPENYILNRILKVARVSISNSELAQFADAPPKLYHNTDPWLTRSAMRKVNDSVILVYTENLKIHKNDEDKFKAEFTYNGEHYEGFSLIDSEYKKKERSIKKAFILVSLPNIPYAKYGLDLYYKFIAAVYPLYDNFEKILAED